VITGLKLVDHKEPIVLIGIPEKRILDAVNKLIGTDKDAWRAAPCARRSRHRQRRHVTVLVIATASSAPPSS